MQAVGKSAHRVHFRGACDLPPAFAILREERNVAADNVFHIDFVVRVVLVADDDGGAGNVFHASVFDPKFVGIVRVNRNGGRDILELRTNEGEAGFVFADGGFALAFEGGVNNGELPAGGGLARPDGVLAAEEVDVLRDVAAIFDSR